MDATTGCRRMRLEEGLAAVPGPGGDRFAPVDRRRTREVAVRAPPGPDPQQRHSRDEVYVVVRGSGRVACDDSREPFGPGDFLFVPDCAERRFEDFTPDLSVWGLLIGPEGGERPAGT